MFYSVVADSQSFKGKFVRQSFDREYVERLRNGDAETERHFTDYFGALLSNKLRTRCYHAHMIEDLRQEAFLRVLVALKKKNCLQCPESLGAFVDTVCHNLLFEMYRSKYRTQSYLPKHLDVPDERASAESQLVTEDRKRQVRQVLEDLPPKDRELLRLVFYEEADNDEICRRFRVNRRYLRVLVHRAKSRLLDIFAKRGHGRTHTRDSTRDAGKGLREITVQSDRRG
jgi:RNA polymerase sigma-70 factor (ECF subfamily)